MGTSGVQALMVQWCNSGYLAVMVATLVCKDGGSDCEDGGYLAVMVSTMVAMVAMALVAMETSRVYQCLLMDCIWFLTFCQDQC